MDYEQSKRAKLKSIYSRGGGVVGNQLRTGFVSQLPGFRKQELSLERDTTCGLTSTIPVRTFCWILSQLFAENTGIFREGLVIEERSDQVLLLHCWAEGERRHSSHSHNRKSVNSPVGHVQSWLAWNKQRVFFTACNCTLYNATKRAVNTGFQF